MQEFFIENGDLILKLILSVVLGSLIGAERFFARKEAGMKTHALVSLGSAVFVVVATILYTRTEGIFDMSKLVSQIIVGIGFLGAGSIMLSGSHVKGLTTAGGLWVTSAIGMAVGFGLYDLAIITTILVLLIFILMNIIEKPIGKISNDIFEKEN